VSTQEGNYKRREDEYDGQIEVKELIKLTKEQGGGQREEGGREYDKNTLSIYIPFRPGAEK